jgi:hypothetical protein
MTLLAPDDNRLIFRVRLTGEGRWVSLSLSLGEPDASARFLTVAERLWYEMKGLDEAAQKFGLSNWQGGIISGARYAFRALKVSPQQVHVHELRGQLGSGDIGALASAAAVAIARLLGRPAEFPVDLTGWKLDEETWRPPSSAAEVPTPGAEVIPSPPEPRPEPTGKPPPPLGRGQTENSADPPNGPGAAAEQSPN